MVKRTNTVTMVSGYKRAGKDYVSDLLVTKLANARKISFAEPLKRVIATLFGINVETLEIFKNNKEVISFLGQKQTDFRQLLQRLKAFPL